MTLASARAALAIPFALVTAAMLPAQTHTTATYCGSSSSVGVLNVGQATATVSSTPGVDEELWAQGNFLGYSGRFYTAEMESYSAGSSRFGIGLCSLTVGSNTVSLWTNTLFSTVSRSVRMDVVGADTSRQYTIGGLPVVVSGNVQVNLSANVACAWPSHGVMVDGTLSGDGTGRMTAGFAVPLPYFGATVGSTMQFGRQQFQGHAEVWSGGDNSSLRYDMDPMILVMWVRTTFFGGTLTTAVLLNTMRSAVHIASFL